MDVFERDFDVTEFYRMYWDWLFGRTETHPMNEEIERWYRQRIKHVPKRCPHGLTILTCADCNFNGWKGE